MTYLESLTPEERREMIDKAKDRIPNVYSFLKGHLTEDLIPYIQDELDKPEYEGLTLADLVPETPEDDDKIEWHRKFLLIRAVMLALNKQVADALDRMYEKSKTLELDKEDLKDLEPFLLKELKKPEYNGLTLKDLFKEYGATDADLINNADARGAAILNALGNRAAAADKEGKREELQKLPKIEYIEDRQVIMNIDNLITSAFLPKDEGKEETTKEEKMIPVNYAGPEEPALLLYYNFQFGEKLKEMNIPEEVDAEDLFIISFLDHFYKSGTTTVSGTKFYKEMNGDDPNPEQLEKLVERLTKLSMTHIQMNDKEISEARGLKTYREIKPVQVAPVIIANERYVANGKITKTVINITSAPQILRIGQALNQITTINKNLLYVKKYKTVEKKIQPYRSVNRTPRFYKVLYYLLKRIARMKHPGSKLNRKILYSTFYEEMNETTTKGRRAALKTLFEILDHFKFEGYIKGYEEETTKSTGEVGVIIKLPSKTPEIADKE